MSEIGVRAARTAPVDRVWATSSDDDQPYADDVSRGRSINQHGESDRATAGDVAAEDGATAVGSDNTSRRRVAIVEPTRDEPPPTAESEAPPATGTTGTDDDEYPEDTPLVDGEWDERGRRIPIKVVPAPLHPATRYRPTVAMSECSSESQATVLAPAVHRPLRRATQTLPAAEPPRAATLQSHTVFAIGADGEADEMSSAVSRVDEANRAANASVASGTATMMSDSVATRLPLEEVDERGRTVNGFSKDVGYRTGFLRSVPPDQLATSAREGSVGPAEVKVLYACDLGPDALRCASWDAPPRRVAFRASHCFRRRARQPNAVTVAPGDPWMPGTDLPELEDPGAELGFIRNPGALRDKRRLNAAAHGLIGDGDDGESSTMATSDSDARDSASVDSRPPVEYEEETPSERTREEATDEERARTFDEWQIHEGPRSCGVMLTVESVMNLKLEEGRSYECAVYYRDEKKTKGALDQAGVVDMQYYLSVPDDTVPLVFLIVERKLFGRKGDVAIGAVTINHPEVQPLKGVTADNTYWEKAAVSIPLVDPKATSSTVGALRIAWHADMRVDKGPDDLFCRICGRLKTVDSEGRRIFCLCDKRRQQEMEMKEQLERETREAMLQRQREKRLAGASAGDEGGDTGDGETAPVKEDDVTCAGDMAIPRDAEMPDTAKEVHEFAKVSKTEFHKGCCVVM